MKQTISETNPMLLTYLKYLQMTYSSDKTKQLYESHARKFLNEIYNKTKEEPTELTQNIIDEYVIWLNSSKTTNPFYRAWIKSFRLAFDPDEKIFRLKTKLDRSKERTKIAVYDWMPKETVDILIAKGSPYMSMMVSIFFDTGRRLNDVISCDLNNTKDWDIDLVKRTIRGLSKNNMEFRGHFRKETADKIYHWIKNPLCINKTMPFAVYKKDGELAANQESAFDYRLKQECKYLGLKDVHGKDIHTHALRHSTGRYLGDVHKWKIEQVAVKLGHLDINQTRKYVSPDLEQIEAKEDSEVFNS
jgi:integrase